MKSSRNQDKSTEITEIIEIIEISRNQEKSGEIKWNQVKSSEIKRNQVKSSGIKEINKPVGIRRNQEKCIEIIQTKDNPQISFLHTKIFMI